MGQSEPNLCYCAVRVCFCVILVLGCGYSIVRQQILEQRLQVLEEQQMILELLVRPTVPKVQVSRSRRDVTDCICPAGEDLLPEEFLMALGKEGEEIKEVGEAIRSELALRWSRIMCDGLGKEAKDQIIQKYPVPQNFPQAVAPAMNPEILSSLSELTVKRDKRIMARQNVIGKIMSSLGKALTSLLKGNINSQILIEEINDAAKLAAEVFHQDSSSRKFFALSGANQTVKEAVRNEKPDGLLFGINCADKIRAAQTIQKTGSQIKNIGLTTKTPQKPHKAPVKKQGNWKSLPQQQQQHYRGRGRLPQAPRKQFSQPHPYQRDSKRPTRANYRQ